VLLGTVFSSSGTEQDIPPATTLVVAETVPSTTTTSTTALPSTTTTTVLELPLELIGVGITDAVPESLHPFVGDPQNRVFTEIQSAIGTFALESDLSTLNPIPGVLAAVPSLENGGIRYNEDGSVVLRYEIDPEATWSDGVSVSGQDFLFTAQILREDSRVPSEVRSLYRLIDSDSWVVEGRSVQFSLSERTLAWLDLFSPLMPAHQLFETDFLDDWEQQAWVTAGPYYLASVDTNTYVLRANTFHPRSDTLIPEIVVRVFPYEGALVGALELGIVQVGQASEPVVLDRLLALDDVIVVTGPGTEWEHIAFQFGSGRFVANVGSLSGEDSFRELTAGLIDRQELVTEFFDGSKGPISTVVGMSWPGAAGDGWTVSLSDEELIDLRDDLYRELGVDTPLTVSYVTTDDLSRNLLASELVQAYAQFDIELEVGLEEPGLFFNDTVIPGQFDVAQWAWTATPGPQGAVMDVQDRFVDVPRSGGFNFYQWGAPGSVANEGELERFRTLLEEIEQEMDVARLAGLLQEVDNILAEQVVVVPLFSDLVHVGVDERLLGLLLPVGGQPLLGGVEDWFIEDGT